MATMCRHAAIMMLMSAMNGAMIKLALLKLHHAQEMEIVLHAYQIQTAQACQQQPALIIFKLVIQDYAALTHALILQQQHLASMDAIH